MAATRHYKFFDRTTGHTFLAEGTTESTALRLAMASRIESFGVSSSADMRAAMLNGDAVYDINGMSQADAIERAAQTAAQAAGNDLDDDAEAAADKRARKVVAAESGAPL